MEIKDGEHYTIGKWHQQGHDYDNLTCTKCAFSTLYPEKMQDHWNKETKHGHIWGKPGESPTRTEMDTGILEY